MRDELAYLKIKVRAAKGSVCTPLDVMNKIASVAPDVWNDTCGMEGSWYRTSEKNGLYLVVSSFELEGYEDRKSAVLTESDFVPPKLASLKNKGALSEDPRLRERLPSEWKQVGEICISLKVLVLIIQDMFADKQLLDRKHN